MNRYAAFRKSGKMMVQWICGLTLRDRLSSAELCIEPIVVHYCVGGFVQCFAGKVANGTALCR